MINIRAGDAGSRKGRRLGVGGQKPEATTFPLAPVTRGGTKEYTQPAGELITGSTPLAQPAWHLSAEAAPGRRSGSAWLG